MDKPFPSVKKQHFFHFLGSMGEFLPMHYSLCYSRGTNKALLG